MRLRAILDTAVEGIVTIDQRGIVTSFNLAARRMFGYETAEVVGQNISVLMPEPYRGEHDGYLAGYLKTGHAKIIGIGREAVGRRKDGTIFPIELAVSEVRVGQNRTFTGIVRDISERKQLEREILEASEREQQKIGHDLHDGLCQELAGIAFLVQSIQQKVEARGRVSPDEVAKVTALLQDAIRHTRGLARTLHPVEPLPFGLSVALRDLAAHTADTCRIACTFRSRNPVEIHDPSTATHIYRIAQDAVRDAVRHGKADNIVIELLRNRSGIQLSISDNGIKLSEDGRLREDKVLWMMQHRARVIGARVHAQSCRGIVRITCDIPDQPVFPKR